MPCKRFRFGLENTGIFSSQKCPVTRAFVCIFYLLSRDSEHTLFTHARTALCVCRCHGALSILRDSVGERSWPARSAPLSLGHNRVPPSLQLSVVQLSILLLHQRGRVQRAPLPMGVGLSPLSAAAPSSAATALPSPASGLGAVTAVFFCL